MREANGLIMVKTIQLRRRRRPLAEAGAEAAAGAGAEAGAEAEAGAKADAEAGAEAPGVRARDKARGRVGATWRGAAKCSLNYRP